MSDPHMPRLLAGSAMPPANPTPRAAVRSRRRIPIPHNRLYRPILGSQSNHAVADQDLFGGHIVANRAKTAILFSPRAVTGHIEPAVISPGSWLSPDLIWGLSRPPRLRLPWTERARERTVGPPKAVRGG